MDRICVDPNDLPAYKKLLVLNTSAEINSGTPLAVFLTTVTFNLESLDPTRSVPDHKRHDAFSHV
jgi:hypothetical protein